MVLHISVRSGQLVQLSIRFQLVHKTASWDEGVNANVTEQKKHRKTHSHSLAFNKHPLSVRSAQLSLPIPHSEQSLFKSVTILISFCGEDMKNVLQDQKDDIVSLQITYSTHRKG